VYPNLSGSKSKSLSKSLLDPDPDFDPDFDSMLGQPILYRTTTLELIQVWKPGPQGQVRDNRLSHKKIKHFSGLKAED
jgi:hypothetical protein